MSVQLCLKTPNRRRSDKLGWIQLWLWMCYEHQMQSQKQMHSAFPKAEFKSQMKRQIQPFNCCCISVCSQQDLNSKLWTERGAAGGLCTAALCRAAHLYSHSWQRGTVVDFGNQDTDTCHPQDLQTSECGPGFLCTWDIRQRRNVTEAGQQCVLLTCMTENELLVLSCLLEITAFLQELLSFSSRCIGLPVPRKI